MTAGLEWGQSESLVALRCVVESFGLRKGAHIDINHSLFHTDYILKQFQVQGKIEPPCRKFPRTRRGHGGL